MTLQPVKIKIAVFIFSLLSAAIHTTAQTIQCEPDDLTIECAENTNQTTIDSWHEANELKLMSCGLTVCDSSMVSSDYDYDNLFKACGNAGVIDVVYTITGCGNVVEVTASVNLFDTTQPVVSCNPENHENEDCDNASIQPLVDRWDSDNIGMLESCSTDACSQSQIIVTSDYGPGGYSCGDSITVVYTIEDDCGNFVEVSATYNSSSDDTGGDDTGGDDTGGDDTGGDDTGGDDTGGDDTGGDDTGGDDTGGDDTGGDDTGGDETDGDDTGGDETDGDDTGGDDTGGDDTGDDDTGGDGTCGAVGGYFITIETDTTEVTVCVGDGISDAVFAKVWEEEGETFKYIDTDTDGNILRITDGIKFEYEGTEVGTNFIYHISMVGEVSGLEVGSNISDLSGCFELSNAIRVNKIDDGDQCGCAMIVSLGSPQAICEGESITIDADVMNSNICEIICSEENAGTLVEWDMDACHSVTNGIDNKDFSELGPKYPNADDCVNVEATPVNVEGGMHSCTIPKDGLGGRAMCFSGSKKCYWKDDSPDALKFSVTLTPENSSTITGLEFYESAPKRFTWYNPDFSEDIDEGPNNFPRFYGLRVTKNGEEIYQQNDIPTTNDWTLEEFDFSDNDAFKVTENTTFVFELLAYCPAWRNAITYAWDLDNIKLLGGCCEKDTTITAVDYAWSTGETTQSITVTPTEDTEYSVTVTDCLGCVATKTLPVTVKKPVTADLGDDISVCREDLPVLLTHSTEGIDSKHPRVEWSTGEVGDSILVTEAGTYTVTVTDGIACSDTDEIEVSINDPDPLTLPDNVDPVCAGNTIELSTLEPDGRTGGVWTDASGNVVTDVGAGDYTYTYADSNGCTVSGIVTIAEDNFSFTIADQGPICPDEEFDFSTIIPDGVDGDNWEVTDLELGRYLFVGTNANGCTASAEFNISIDDFGFALADPPVLCEGEMYMLADQEPSDYPGGVWTDMDGNVVDVAIPGMFTYTVSNENGCSSSDKITFTSSGFQLMQIADDSVCWGDSILLSTLEFPDQSGGFWKDLNNNVVTYGFQDEFYRYHLFDDVNGCADIVTIKIHEKHCHDACEDFTVTVQTPDPICNDESITLSTLESEETSGGTWTNAEGTVVTSGGIGIYSYVYIGGDGCMASAQLEISSKDCADPCDTFNISFSNPEAICNDATLDLSTLVPAVAAGGEWTNADGGVVTIVGPGIYSYSVTTAAGCSATADVTIPGKDCSDPCSDLNVATPDLGADREVCESEFPIIIQLDASDCIKGVVLGKVGDAEISDDDDQIIINGPGDFTVSLIDVNDNTSGIDSLRIRVKDCTDPCDNHVPMLDLGDDVTLCEDDAPYVYVASLVCTETITYNSDGAEINVSGDTLFVFTSGTIDAVVTGPDGETAMDDLTITFEDCSDPGTPCDDGNPNTENDIMNDDCNCCGTPIAGQVIYVDQAAAGSTDGTSWTNAYTDLQEAMQLAQAGQEIWLADGVYLPTKDGNRDAYFNLPSGVDLYGGFAGGESTICQRDFSNTRSVLSGDLNQDDKVDVVNIVPLELLFTGTEENSHYVLRNSQVSDDIKIDGVAISGGVADGSNTAGGGGFLFVNEEDATLEMNNVLVIHNQGAGLGGAGRINTRSATIFTVKMNRVVFLQNQVSGPALSKGGGLFAAGYDGGLVDMELTNCLFAQNFAENRGGAVNTDENVKSTYSNTLFAGNKASDGGAIFENGGMNEVVHTNNTFYINFADETGGAIVNFSDFGNNTIDVRNSIFFGNATSLAGGPGFDNFGNASDNFAIQNSLFSEMSLAIIESEAVGIDDRGGNLFGADPLFTDPLNADFTLQSSSPAIDAGVGSFNTLMEDIAGKVRVQGAEIDLGANESGDEVTCNFDRFDFDLAYAPPIYDEIEFINEEEESEVVAAARVEVKTYPNPASNEMNVVVSKMGLEDEISLKLYDMSGRGLPIDYGINIDNGLTVEYSIPVNDLLGGVYFLKTTVGRFTINKRVIIVK